MNAVRRRIVVAALAAAFVSRGLFAAEQPKGVANGVFLVAKPDLQDPNFRETVVLITQPQLGGGQLGVIVNRPLGGRLSEIYPGATRVPEQFDAIYAGGPVQRDRVLFLLRSSQHYEHSLQVLEDVYLSGDRALLERIVRGEVQVPAFRAYAGFSGWAPRQLQVEIARGGWYVIKADAETLFSADSTAMWPELIKRINTRSTALPSIEALASGGR